MATATMEPKTAVMASETEIDVRQETLLDEIEINHRLSKSLEQFKRGETMTLDEMEKRTTERLRSKYGIKKIAWHRHKVCNKWNEAYIAR
ncbi:MAG: hypothetical protein FWC15_00380 [Fibromonadales bacterium]|nr:hypothetical protein [Fibromonadales bacterium]